ncbi:MAG: universal stress protein [Candidatus Binatia bacterium]
MPRDFKAILCPTDFSPESYQALEYGVRFARISQGTILIAHILHNPASQEFQPDGYVLSFDQAKVRAQSALEDVRANRVGADTKCELLVDIGDPYDRLMAVAKERQVDLIVTSTHGRTGLKHLVLGSVAEKLIRHAPCPVFVVRRAAG